MFSFSDKSPKIASSSSIHHSRQRLKKKRSAFFGSHLLLAVSTCQAFLVSVCVCFFVCSLISIVVLGRTDMFFGRALPIGLSAGRDKDIPVAPPRSYLSHRPRPSEKGNRVGRATMQELVLRLPLTLLLRPIGFFFLKEKSQEFPLFYSSQLRFTSFNP